MFMNMITTCSDSIQMAANFGYGCDKAQISAVCPVTCKSCPTIAPTTQQPTVAPSPIPTESPTFMPTVPSGAPITVAHYPGANAAAVNRSDGPAIAPSLASAHGSLRRSE
jgi:hypothetical protein